MYTKEVGEYLSSRNYVINLSEFEKIMKETPQLVLVKYMPEIDQYHIILDNDIDETNATSEEIAHRLEARKKERMAKYVKGDWDFSSLPNYDFKLVKTKQ